MDFMRTSTFKDSWYALSREKRTEITMANIAFHEKYLKTGKLKDTYTFVDNGKYMAIWNVDSLEELGRIVTDSPYAGFVNTETLPFLDHKAVVKWGNDIRAAAQKTARK